MNKKIIAFLFIISTCFSFGQDGQSLILVHNYADKPAIDAITNHTQGDIAYNATDKNIYVFDGTNWVLSSEHSGTTGSIFFAGTDGLPTEDNANLFWDDTSNFLGLGTNTPDSSLHIISTSPDIILDDTSAGYNTISYRRNGTDKALVGLDNNDDFYISINDTGYHDDAFTIQNSNRFVGISVDEANSTLQIGGSISKPIIRTQTTGVNLNDPHYAIIITDPTHNIVIPTADATNTGREYIIKNTTDSDVTTSEYRDNSDTDTTTIPANNVLKIQSDGAFWNQINNYSSFGTSLTTPIYPFSNNFDDIIFDDTGDNGSGNTNNTELEFDYDGNGALPDITQLQILISYVPYSNISFDRVDIRQGPDVDITAYTTVVSALNTDGTTYNHLITIDLTATGIVIEDNDTVDVDFNRAIVPGGVEGPDGSDTEYSVTFFTN